jgi:hypothetical protein
MALLGEMAALLPGSKLTANRRGGYRLVFEVDGCWLGARARETPFIEIFIRTLDLPGFELRLDAADGGSGEVETSDGRLAELWLDDPAREALALVTGYRYRLERGEVLVTRRNEDDPHRLAAAVRAGGMLAARPHRIARVWHEVARDLGGTTTTDRWDLARDFAVTIDRGPVKVLIVNHRGPPGVLRTEVRAIRLTPGAPPDDAFAPVAALVATANPDELAMTADRVSLTWNRLLLSPALLGPAVEICARLAAPSIDRIGPYR